MYIDLDQRLIPDAFEAVDLSRFDDKNVAGARLEFFSVDVPDAAAFANELNFIVWMAMWTGPTAGLRAQEEDRESRTLREPRLTQSPLFRPAVRAATQRETILSPA